MMPTNNAQKKTDNCRVKHTQIKKTNMFHTVEIDGGFYTAKFDSLLLKDAVVEADGIIPPLREEDPPSSDSDVDDTGDNDDEAYAKGKFGSFALFEIEAHLEICT